MHCSKTIERAAAVAFLACALTPPIGAQQTIPNSGQQITPTAGEAHKRRCLEALALC